MERLKAADILQARQTPAAEKLHQALELMAMGLEIKRDNLRRRHPDESNAQIQARFQKWLERIDD